MTSQVDREAELVYAQIDSPTAQSTMSIVELSAKKNTDSCELYNLLD
jgi:hypothetical protein